jgi:hypothetical protein
MPIHLAAMNGRSDVIEIFFKFHLYDSISTVLSKDTGMNAVRSPTFFAISNDHQNCAAW